MAAFELSTQGQIRRRISANFPTAHTLRSPKCGTIRAGFAQLIIAAATSGARTLLRSRPRTAQNGCKRIWPDGVKHLMHERHVKRARQNRTRSDAANLCSPENYKFAASLRVLLGLNFSRFTFAAPRSKTAGLPAKPSRCRPEFRWARTRRARWYRRRSSASRRPTPRRARGSGCRARPVI